MSLLRMASSRSGFGHIVGSGVRIEGDADTGRAFRDALRHLEVDWEEVLARRIGDIPAHQIGNWFRALSGWGERTRTALQLDTQEYLQEEIRLLPSRAELEVFFERVDTLRDDLARLDAQLRRLEASVPEEE